MRVLCITSSYPRHEHDIAGCFVKRWREVLEQRGVRVKVLTWQLDKVQSCAPCMMDEGVFEVRYAPHAWQSLFHGAGAPENLTRRPWLAGLIPSALLSMWWQALQHIRREPPDLIVGHWLLPSGFLARHLGRVCQIPSLIVTHSGGIAALSMLPAPPLVHALARYLADGPMTFVSEQARDRFAQLGVCSVATLPVLPMGFDAPLVTRTDEARRDILMLGRAVEIKGGGDVLRALARASCWKGRGGQRGRGVVHMIGDGPELATWRDLAREEGVEVVAHGTLTGLERDRVMARCKIAIFGSRRLETGREEGLPVSVLECAAAGVMPMVAHVPSSYPLLASPELQRLDPSRDPDTWSRQIDALHEVLGAREGAALVEAQRQAVAGLEWCGALGERWYDYVVEAVRDHKA